MEGVTFYRDDVTAAEIASVAFGRVYRCDDWIVMIVVIWPVSRDGVQSL